MINKKEQFVLALQGKHHLCTLTDWYWQGCDIRGKYKPTNRWVAYDSDYIEKVIDNRIIILKGIGGYILLEDKNGK